MSYDKKEKNEVELHGEYIESVKNNDDFYTRQLNHTSFLNKRWNDFLDKREKERKARGC